MAAILPPGAVGTLTGVRAIGKTPPGYRRAGSWQGHPYRLQKTKRGIISKNYQAHILRVAKYVPCIFDSFYQSDYSQMFCNAVKSQSTGNR